MPVEQKSLTFVELTHRPAHEAACVVYRKQTDTAFVAYAGVALPDGRVLSMVHPMGSVSGAQLPQQVTEVANALLGLRQIYQAYECGPMAANRADTAMAMDVLLAKGLALRLQGQGGNGKDHATVIQVAKAELPTTQEGTQTTKTLLHLPHHARQEDWLGRYMMQFVEAGATAPIREEAIGTVRIEGGKVVAFPTLPLTPDTTAENYLVRLGYGLIASLAEGTGVQLLRVIDDLVKGNADHEQPHETISRIQTWRS